MAQIKVGVQIKPQHTSYEDYARAWLRADELGVDSIWNWDHFFPLSGDPDGPHFEGWTTAAAIGAQTKRATIGSLVLCMSYRNPAHLSQMAKTLDHATGGRFILGLGAGWFERDYNEYGYDFGTAGDRLRNLERGLEIIKERWAKDPPRPTNGRDVPILIGGGGEKVTLRIVAQHADLWNGFGPPERFAAKNRILDEWCAKVGRDPAAIERTAMVGAGDLDTLDNYLDAGATHLIYGLDAPFDFAPLERLIAWRDSK
ncbi:MAG TPA: LLM class F420-dependent oxidoreductase [Thermomicrobiales bacterium]|jgi:probable F420-dependent oxidoreductase